MGEAVGGTKHGRSQRGSGCGAGSGKMRTSGLDVLSSGPEVAGLKVTESHKHVNRSDSMGVDVITDEKKR